MTTRLVPRRRCAGPCGLMRPATSFVSEKGRTCAVCRKAASRTSARRRHLRNTYEMTPEFAAKLLAYQDNRCAICGGTRPYNLPLDHDHSKPDGPESWRGFLCKAHNKLLRDVRDNPQILLAAAEYLRDPPAQRLLNAARS